MEKLTNGFIRDKMSTMKGGYNMSEERYFNKFITGIMPGMDLYDFADKKENVSRHIAYMLNRTQKMFKWDGLPETIPARVLELYLQINGNVCFYEHNGGLYVFVGGLGGKPDVYYRPTTYVIANPALKLNKTVEIDVDGVVMPNDCLYMGLIPMFERYATAMTETELSLWVASINSRIINLISAPDDPTKESADKYIEDVKNGKLSSIAENAFLGGVRSQPYGTTGTHVITDLIELEQYFKASWFNELGLNANYNMKRESLNSSESQLNNDSLLPLVDDMFEQRKIGCEKVNKMFGTQISVELASSWEDNQEEIDLEHDSMTVSGQPENDPEEMKGGKR